MRLLSMGRTWWDVYKVCFWRQWQPGSWSNSRGDIDDIGALLWDFNFIFQPSKGWSLLKFAGGGKNLEVLKLSKELCKSKLKLKLSRQHLNFVPRWPLGSTSGWASGWGWASSTASSSPSSPSPSSSASGPTSLRGAKKVWFNMFLFFVKVKGQ